ncbi:hypothetical protein M408DRAFT_98723 [Serendipita vermifera MAFF 305830]|uniref:Uncharacterized protein n=1 Tax=Serendipita vermifera MAFF 305830 TaxID=933852 RepID=A0A0C2XLM5_SERVB|nr:hypothetical protein M408DRAFT_98723 [Serendipita vermifera MAFF 305830]
MWVYRVISVLSSSLNCHKFRVTLLRRVHSFKSKGKFSPSNSWCVSNESLVASLATGTLALSSTSATWIRPPRPILRRCSSITPGRAELAASARLLDEGTTLAVSAAISSFGMVIASYTESRSRSLRHLGSATLGKASVAWTPLPLRRCVDSHVNPYAKPCRL